MYFPAGMSMPSTDDGAVLLKDTPTEDVFPATIMVGGIAVGTESETDVGCNVGVIDDGTMVGNNGKPASDADVG